MEDKLLLPEEMIVLMLGLNIGLVKNLLRLIFFCTNRGCQKGGEDK